MLGPIFVGVCTDALSIRESGLFMACLSAFVLVWLLLVLPETRETKAKDDEVKEEMETKEAKGSEGPSEENAGEGNTAAEN